MHIDKRTRSGRLTRYAGVYLMLFLIGTEAFLISPLLPTIAADLHTTERAAAAVVTAYVLAYAVTSPFLGSVSDRYGRRRSLLLGTTLFVVGNVVAAVSSHLAVLITARAVSGLGAAMVGPSIWAHIAETAPAEERGKAIGVGGGFFAAGQVVGLPVGTFIAGQAGWNASFWTIAGVCVIALLVLRRQVQPQRDAPAPQATMASSMAAVFQVWRHPILGHALVVTVVLMAANLGAYSFLGTVLDDRFGLSVNQRGWVGLLIGAGSFVGSMVAGRLGDRARRAGGRGTSFLPVWCGLLGVAIVATALGSWLWFTLLAVLIWFVASGAFATDQQTLLATAAPQQRATALSWNSSSMYLGTAVGVSLVGAWPTVQQGVAVIGGALAAAAAVAAALLTARIRMVDSSASLRRG